MATRPTGLQVIKGLIEGFGKQKHRRIMIDAVPATRGKGIGDAETIGRQLNEARAATAERTVRTPRAPAKTGGKDPGGKD